MSAPEADTRTDLQRLWPLFALRVASGPLELRPVTDDDIPALADLALAGVHTPDASPFVNNWTDAPADELGRNMARYYWSKRAEMSRDHWTVDFVVRQDDEMVGVQGISAENYQVTKTIETGSWLGLRHQGRGIGTLMRQTICQFAFDYLGAAELTSGAWTDNAASLAVSRKVGYAPNGQRRKERQTGEVAIMQDLVLTPAGMVRHGLEIAVEGLPEVRAFFGLPEESHS
jgi:RimJ/RimL family protein N-acetyltransferase